MAQQSTTLKKNASDYNKLCQEIASLIRRVPALKGKAAPQPIDIDHLFSAELSEELMQDCGLEDDAMEVPAWMADETVRDGIRWMHQLDRCEEERVRLMDERCSLQEWLSEEWDCVSKAKVKAGTGARL